MFEFVFYDTGDRGMSPVVYWWPVATIFLRNWLPKFLFVFSCHFHKQQFAPVWYGD